MKKLITLLYILVAFTAKAQQVALTLAPQGSQPYAAGNSFQVFANYSYSNVNGNVQVSVDYPSSTLSFCGSNSFPYAPAYSTVSPGVTRITYTFPASAGSNQTGVIMMCFNYLCPQTCFGQNIGATFNGNVHAVSHSLNSPATPVTVNATVNNTWNGTNLFHSYNQLTNEVTFRLQVFGSNCHRLDNPTFLVTPNVGTLVSATNATISGNTITPLNHTFFGPNTSYTYYYTIKLPCSVNSTALTTQAQLRGNNCNSINVNIFQFQPATFNVPPQAGGLANAAISVAAFNGYYQITVSNTGNTPLSGIISNVMPMVKTNSVTFSNNTSSNATAAITYFNCSNNASATVPLAAGSSNTSAPSFATKIDLAVNNLEPTQSATFQINYDLTNSCSGVPTQSSFTLTNTFTYHCDAGTLTGACLPCDPGDKAVNGTATYSITPQIVCNGHSSTPGCHEPGDTVEICIKFSNTGSATLMNGVLNYNLNSSLTFIPGSETFTNFSSNPVYQAGPQPKWNLPSIPVGSTQYGICFKVIVNPNAPYGNLTSGFNVTGTGFSGSATCNGNVNICALPKAEVEKLVRGNLDATFSTAGNGHPGSTATYQITVKNTGNTPIDSIVLIDRMPFVGDMTIMSCSPRNSQFSLAPAGPVAIPGATVMYAPVPNVATNWPSAATSCTAPGAFSNTFAPDNLKIVIPVTIPAGGTHVITFNATVPANATPGQMACNSIGLICRFVANNNVASALNPVESNTVCLTVQERVEPPPPCEPCKDLLNGISGTQGQITKTDDYYLLPATLNFGINKPVQEVQISLANVDYSWENKGCGDCKVPAMARGCLFPQSATQTIGGLVWDNYTNAALPPNASLNECMEELIWKLGTAAPAGNYNVPLQISLPSPTVPECCELRIRSICFRVTFKDKDCNTCDTVICIRPGSSDADCCRGGRWTSNQISWGAIAEHPGDIAQKTTITAPGTVISGKIDAKCNESYTLNRNTAYSFMAKYACGSTCPQYTVINISGPGTNVTQQLGNAAYVHSFTQPGTYTVSYTAYCNGVVCEVCRYKVVIKGLIVKPDVPISSASK